MLLKRVVRTLLSQLLGHLSEMEMKEISFCKFGENKWEAPY